MTIKELVLHCGGTDYKYPSVDGEYTPVEFSLVVDMGGGISDFSNQLCDNTNMSSLGWNSCIDFLTAKCSERKGYRNVIRTRNKKYYDIAVGIEFEYNSNLPTTTVQFFNYYSGRRGMVNTHFFTYDFPCTELYKSPEFIKDFLRTFNSLRSLIESTKEQS